MKQAKLIALLSLCLFSPFLFAAPPPQSAKPLKIILDHDGAFEDYYAILIAALESQKKTPKIKLIAVTTNPVGESYCPGTNRLEPVGMESSINGLTQKVLSIAKYKDAQVYSGCGESTTTVSIPANASLNLPATSVKVELPVGGLLALTGIDTSSPTNAPKSCVYHKELVFSPIDAQCYYEFPKRFRDESLLFVEPSANSVLSDNKIKPLKLINTATNASDFIAKKICQANSADPLGIVTVGPMTNLARALDKIEAQPSKYGCSVNPAERKVHLANNIKTWHMGGAWDTNPADNYDANNIYKTRGTTLVDENGNVTQQNDIPVETAGNIYWDPISGFDVFAGHHDVYGAFLSANMNRAQPINGVVDNNNNYFNALNNSEYNIFLDSVAAQKVILGGLSSKIVPTNATRYVPLDGMRTRLGDAISNGSCKTPAAQFMYRVQSANTPDGVFFGYDTLYLWDTLTVTSVYNNFVNFQPIPNLNVTTLTSGKEHDDLNSANINEDIWPRDAGTLYQGITGSNTTLVGLGVQGNSATFKGTFQDYVFTELCSQK